MPLTSTTDHRSVNETLVHPLEPVLGMTPSENCQLQDRNQPQDITDILGMAAYEGYVQTPIQTLDGLYVNQPKHFLPLAEEAKRLAEEIYKEKQAKQWAQEITHSIFPGPTKFITNIGTISTTTTGHGTSSL